MQWGSSCHLFSSRYPTQSNPIKRCKLKQQYRPQAVSPRLHCQSPAVVPRASHDGDPSSLIEQSSSSPPRRARLKPPLNRLLVKPIVILLLLVSSTVVTGSNVPSKSVKLRVFPAARQSVAVETRASFLCTGGQRPYRWEYQIQNEQQMSDWRFKIRSNSDNCLVNATVRPISEFPSNSVWSNQTTGELVFDVAHFNNTGIYRCFSGNNGCVELHVLVFEPIPYTFDVRLIYGLLTLVLFVASLSTAWQLWHSSAFHRRAMARSRSDTDGKAASSNNHNGFGPAAALSPVIRLFQRNRRSPNASMKPDTASSTHAEDSAARWPVLRRRLSSIDDSPTVVAMPVVISPEEQVRVALEAPPATTTTDSC